MHCNGVFKPSDGDFDNGTWYAVFRYHTSKNNIQKMNKKNEMRVSHLQKVFTFDQSKQPIRVEVINDDEPWFCAKDACKAIEISNDRDALSRLDDDERRVSVVPTPSGKQTMNFVNESGLYNLIFQSRKPEAKAFRKWVTSVVLPSIRRTGGYENVLHGVACVQSLFDSSAFYDYSGICTKVGLSSGSGAYDKRVKKYPKEFIREGAKLYVSEKMAKLIINNGQSKAISDDFKKQRELETLFLVGEIAKIENAQTRELLLNRLGI